MTEAELEKELSGLLLNTMAMHAILIWLLTDHINRTAEPLKTLDAAKAAARSIAMHYTIPGSAEQQAALKRNQEAIARSAETMLEELRDVVAKAASLKKKH